jgi:hypothetical protein
MLVIFTVDCCLCLVLSCLALPRSLLGPGGNSFCLRTSTMARVKSTTRSGSEGRDSEGSAERIDFAPMSDVGSCGCAGDEMDKGSHTRSYSFGPSMVMVSRIHWMIDHGYFAEGMAREPREETVLEPNSDKEVVF